MKQFTKLSIPKPCTENWDTMLATEKGKFCQKCTKNVVDFTNMPQQDIIAYLQANQGTKVCGRFTNKQLDTISIEIPSQVFNTSYNFRKTFMLVLLLAMGSTLLSCETNTGKNTTIGKVIVTDTIPSLINTIDTTTHHQKGKVELTDTITSTPAKKKIDPICTIEMGEAIIEAATMGDVEMIEEPPVEVPTTAQTSATVLTIFEVDASPQFLDAPANNTNTRNQFFNYIQEFFTTHANKKLLQKELEVYSENKLRIYTEFKVDTLGNITIQNTRAYNATLEQHVREVCKLLPQVKPAMHNNKKVVVSFTYPFIISRENL